MIAQKKSGGRKLEDAPVQVVDMDHEKMISPAMLGPEIYIISFIMYIICSYSRAK